MGAVVAVVDVTHLSAPPVDPFEHHRSILLAVIAVLDIDADAGMAGEVRPVEGVGGIGWIVQLDEPFGVFDYPLGKNAGMIGHHVNGDPDAAAHGPVL